MRELEPHWIAPEGGPHHVAIKSATYAARRQEVDGFLGRPLAKRSHDLSFQGETYAIFSFRLEDDAARFRKAFDGEPFDPRDQGSGSNWVRWYKGRAAKRDRNRDPYDFR